MGQNLFGEASRQFERLLRLSYPGLLFWILMPVAVGPAIESLTTMHLHKAVYEGLSLWAHLGIILATGVFFYLV